MNRPHALQTLSSGSREWDVIIVGGGATGLGAAVDAAARGYSTALLEAGDFAHGTSSRSTKLIHGGVRYLRQGNIALVRSALQERELLLRNAPALVRTLDFVIPAYGAFDRIFYGTGLKLYDWLAGGGSGHRSRLWSLQEMTGAFPSVNRDGLRGGIVYQDSQFDDAGFALALARTATLLGAAVANYTQVEKLQRGPAGRWIVSARDVETGSTFELRSRAVINAGGIFADAVRRLDDPRAPRLLRPSQGAHLVLPSRFLPGDRALMIPKTDDGRVLFAIPWLGRVLVGTTDTPTDRIEAAPRPLPEEIEFLLEHAGQYLEPAPTQADILSVFAGLRPLATGGARSTARLSRDHSVTVSSSGLVTVTGGKWTTYRRMAADAVDRAAQVAGLPQRPCPTAALKLEPRPSPVPTEAALHPGLGIHAADIIHAIREDMARSLDDLLARRSRALLLDAHAALAVAPAVAELLAAELGWSPARRSQALDDFRVVARDHLPG